MPSPVNYIDVLLQGAASRLIAVPSNAPVPLSISSVNNENLTVNITVTWEYTQGKIPAQGIGLIWNNNATAPTLASNAGYLTFPPNQTSYTFQGIDPSQVYRLGIAAYNIINGVVYTTDIIAPTSSPDWLTDVNEPTIGGQTVQQVLDNIDTALANTNTSNDLNYDPITIAPTSLTRSQVARLDGSYDITINYAWTGNIDTIDGFVVLAAANPTNAAYTLGQPTDATWQRLPNERSFTYYGAPGEPWYTVGVLVYRRVKKDPVLAPNGLIISSITQLAPFRITANPLISAEVFNITPGSVGAAQLAANAVTNAKILNGEITAVKTAIAAIEPTTGNLSASQITAIKAMFGTLSALQANLGEVNAGNITGTANINIAGQALFNGSTSTPDGNASVSAGTLSSQPVGLRGQGTNTGVSGSGSNAGVAGISSNNGVTGTTSGSGSGVQGTAGISGSFSGAGVTATHVFGGVGLAVNGRMTITSSVLVNSLNADLLDGFHAGNGSGQIPISNGVLNTNLNAAQVAGRDTTQLVRNVFCPQTGTTTADATTIQFNSTIAGIAFVAFSNVVEVYSTSDRRYKENIEPETLGLDFLKQTSPVTYNLILDGKKTKQHGVIAQDMLALTGDDNDSLSLYNNRTERYGTDLTAMIPILINAVKELSIKIDELTNPTT